jgi:regulator of replication initiation timing
MSDKELLDKIISLTEDVVKLKMENERLKTELKHERELNKFRTEFPNKI